jgi:hypothetical protein
MISFEKVSVLGSLFRAGLVLVMLLGIPSRLYAVSFKDLPEATRSTYIRMADVWFPTETGKMDLLAGPDVPGRFSFREEISCLYAEPDPTDPPGGDTSKFECILHDGRKVKIKYDNAEVSAEVAASRLLWALGFGADGMFPVVVHCKNCPKDPFSHIRHTLKLKNQMGLEIPVDPADLVRGDFTFDYAVAELKFDAKKMESFLRPGWSFDELRWVANDEARGRAQRVHREALVLLSGFIQHLDTKPEQQRLVCLPGGVLTAVDGEKSCSKPFLLTHDVGSTFGWGFRLDRVFHGDSISKMEYSRWASVPLWRNATGCLVAFNEAPNATLADSEIHEAARRFLSDRMALLSNAQIGDLFTAAQVNHTAARMRGDDGSLRPVTTADWTQTFLRKRDEMAGRVCPE